MDEAGAGLRVFAGDERETRLGVRIGTVRNVDETDVRRILMDCGWFAQIRHVAVERQSQHMGRIDFGFGRAFGFCASGSRLRAFLLGCSTVFNS